jgi:hypothetical protein
VLASLICRSFWQGKVSMDWLKFSVLVLTGFFAVYEYEQTFRAAHIALAVFSLLGFVCLSASVAAYS